MARPQNKYPIPFTRIKSGTCRVCWKWDGATYEFSTGYKENEKDKAEAICQQTATAIRGLMEWPEWSNGVQAIDRWIKLTEPQEEPRAPEPSINQNDLIRQWEKHYASYTSKRQLQLRVDHLYSLAGRYDITLMTSDQAAAFFSGLGENAIPKYNAGKISAVIGERIMDKVDIIRECASICTPEQVLVSLRNRSVFERVAPSKLKHSNKYRVSIKNKCIAPKTRNNYLMSFNMFFQWAIKNGLLSRNPFQDIKPLKVQRHAEIIWLTREDRESITETCRAMKCEVTVWIALYSGLRLGEISRLRWEDIDLKGRWIHVKKSKTGKPRRVPVFGALLEALTQKAKKSGRIAPKWDEDTYFDQADSDLLPLRKSLPGLADKLKWNIFRHTFASLLAQTGKVSIDQISALMGNTPEVCRRHYAHLIPDAVERTGIDLID